MFHYVMPSDLPEPRQSPSRENSDQVPASCSLPRSLCKSPQLSACENLCLHLMDEEIEALRQTALPRLLVGLRTARYHPDATPDPCAALRQEGSTTHRRPVNANPATWSSYTMTQVAPEVKNPLANTGDAGLIPGVGRSPGGHGNPLEYSCLENPMDRGAWWATVHGVACSLTRLNQLSMHTFTLLK